MAQLARKKKNQLRCLLILETEFCDKLIGDVPFGRSCCCDKQLGNSIRSEGLESVSAMYRCALDTKIIPDNIACRRKGSIGSAMLGAVTKLRHWRMLATLEGASYFVLGKLPRL